MKKILAISTAVSLSLGGVMTALPANAVGGNPTFSTSAFDATEGAAFDVTLNPTFSGVESWYYGSRAFLDVATCDALPSGLSYVQDGVENGNGIAPTYQIAGTPDAGTAGVYNVCFSTDDNPEGWWNVGTSAPVTITVAAAPVTTTVAASVPSVAAGESVTVSVADATEGSWVGWFINGAYVDGASAASFPQTVNYGDFVFENPAVDNVVTWAVYDSPQLEALLANAVSTVDVTWSAAAAAPDYTINCSDPQGAPYVNYGSGGDYYGAWDIDFGGAAEVTKTVAVSGCGYYVADDVASGIVNEYVGTSATTLLTVVIPVDGYAYVRGYNTWDVPNNTAFMIQFWNSSEVVPDEPINSDIGVCDNSTDVVNTYVTFEGVCDGTADVSDASTEFSSDAYDGFGDVYGVNWDGSQFLIGATEILDAGAGGVYSYVSSNIWSHEAQEYVDVYVNRTFIGNTAKWEFEVYSTGTLTPSTLNVFIDGNLGSDEDTTWTTSNGHLVSTEGENLGGDPAIVWDTVGNVVHEDLNDDVTVEFGAVASGSLTHILLGYQDCITPAQVMEGIDVITASFSSYVNANIPDISGDCTVTFAVNNNGTFVNGTENSVDFGVSATGPWDWTYGGNINLDGLPYGLDYEVNSWVEGTIPSFTVYGVADSQPGDYEVVATLWDDFGNETTTTFIITVEAAPVVISADLSLNQPVGSNIADTGADYAAEGLMVESEWTLTLRSTPQVIGSGFVDGSGSIFGTATIPAGLEAGWHSITLTGTDVNGDAVSKVVWFELSADGTILAEQGTEPVIEPAANNAEPLPHTGSDFAGGLIAGGTLLAAGLAMVAARRRMATN